MTCGRVGTGKTFRISLDLCNLLHTIARALHTSSDLTSLGAASSRLHLLGRTVGRAARARCRIEVLQRNAEVLSPRAAILPEPECALLIFVPETAYYTRFCLFLEISTAPTKMAHGNDATTTYARVWDTYKLFH